MRVNYAIVFVSDTPGVEQASGKEPAGRCRPGFGVADLTEFHQRMVEQKVPCVQEPTETFGARIAQ